jgi:hypothetical protein
MSRGIRSALLHELLPTVRRVCVLTNPAGRTTESLRKANETAYRSLGLQPLFIEVETESQFLDAVAEALRQRAEALDFAHLSAPRVHEFQSMYKRLRGHTGVGAGYRAEAALMRSCPSIPGHVGRPEPLIQD